ALEIAAYLESHPKVRRVIYPGLTSHPQHALAKAQMQGFGGMVSFELNGHLEQTKAVIEKLELFHVAESLGGVESLVELPAIMTHASVPATIREAIGLSDSLVR